MRDIHRNPVKAGIVGEASKYRWSSYSEYIYSKGYFTDIDFVLGILNPNRNEAVRIFKEFMTEENKDECLDDEVKKRKFSDEDAIKLIRRLIKSDNVQILQQMNKKERNNIIRVLKEKVSIRQLARVTGLSKRIIEKA